MVITIWIFYLWGGALFPSYQHAIRHYLFNPCAGRILPVIILSTEVSAPSQRALSVQLIYKVGWWEILNRQESRWAAKTGRGSHLSLRYTLSISSSSARFLRSVPTCSSPLSHTCSFARSLFCLAFFSLFMPLRHLRHDYSSVKLLSARLLYLRLPFLLLQLLLTVNSKKRPRFLLVTLHEYENFCI